MRVESQFPFPVFSLLWKDSVESSNFMWGRFWCYCRAASLVLFIPCLPAHQTVCGCEILWPDCCQHVSHTACWVKSWRFPSFLSHCDKSHPQRAYKHNQNFRLGFPETPLKFLTPAAWSISSQDHDIYHRQMLTSRFACNATPNIIILLERWVMQSYLVKKI